MVLLLSVAPPVGAWIETVITPNGYPVKGSRPPWARGLKHQGRAQSWNQNMSRPPWARGLKLTHHISPTLHPFVAPPVGAWIETVIIAAIIAAVAVAPPVGAWIETKESLLPIKVPPQSRPPWARGLKQRQKYIIKLILSRAPRGRVD